MDFALLRPCIAIGLAAAATMARAEEFRWLQFVPDGLEARVVTRQDACPAAELDGRPAAMHIRAPAGERFPILVCALPIPTAARSASIADVPLALPKSRIRRIAVVGDTGCRIKGQAIQDCNSPTEWPFRQIAQSAAALRPDLVIHVGDYLYRETPCPAGEEACAGSPYGDTWAAWRADFFDPSQGLLGAAPWIFLRGNHEACDRGGKGWTRLLDPRPFDTREECRGSAAPFVTSLGGLHLAVMDVSTAEQNAVSPSQVAEFQRQFAQVGRAPYPTWLLLHRPIYSVVKLLGSQVIGGNATLAAAVRGVLPNNVTLLLSGHDHVFQVLAFDQNLPPQLIVGHSGTYLDEGVANDSSGLTVEGVKITTGLSKPNMFGFVVLEQGSADWHAVNHDVQGRPGTRCRIMDRNIGCE